MNIDHIGIVVKSLEKAIPHWQKVFGYSQATEIILNTRQKVKVVFLEKSGSLPIKLIEPADETSPIYVFSKKGGGLHHLCFMCDNIEDEVETLKAQRLRVLAEPEPGEAFANNKIAFVYTGHGLNIELIDTEERAGRL